MHARRQLISQHIAIIWDRPYLIAVEIAGGLAAPRVERVIEREIDDALDDGELISELGDWLQAQFADAKSVSVVYPRDRVTWRDFDVPHVPENELPAIVQYQFAAQVSGSSDRSVIDFLPPAPTRDADQPIRVHAAAIPERGVVISRRLAELLDAELTTVCISSVALLEVVERLSGDRPNAATVAVVAAGRRYTEAITRDAGDVTRSVARRLDGTASGALAGEVRRAELLLEDDESVVLVFDPDGQVSSDGGANVRCLGVADVPFQSASDVSACSATLLAAVGSYWAGAEARTPQINFAAPRQPVPPRDRTKDYVRFGIAAAALLIVGVGLKTWSDVADLNDRIETTESRIDEIDTFLDRQGKVRDIRASLESYVGSRMPMGEIVDRVMVSMPTHDRLIIASLEPSQTTGTNVARVTGRAYAASRSDAELFEAELDRYYQVKPKAKQPSDERPGYPISLDFEFDVPLKRDTAIAEESTDESESPRSASRSSESPNADLSSTSSRGDDADA